MPKHKRGLVVGKFLPFHKGHEALIRYAKDKVESLTVIVCHTGSYNIDPKLRKSWIKEVFPNVEVKILEHGDYLDDDTTATSKEWAELTVSFLGYTPDIVFSSENYGKAYADFMGSEHEMYDKERNKVPISATEIRKNPFKHWEMISENVRAYYCKRIVVLGAESTGTTTLAKDLSEYYKTPWVPEYGRLYYEGRQKSTYADDWDTNEFIHIAQSQNKLEDELAKKSNRVLICDTDSFTTSVWHLRYTGKNSRRVEDLSKNRDYDLYILTAPDIPFDQDGTRDGEHLREWMHNVFVDKLKEENKKFIIVKGSKEKRLNKSIKAIDKLLAV